MFAPKKILVPVDLSEYSAKAISYGADLARLTNASLTVLTVVNDVLPVFEFFPIDARTADFLPGIEENSARELQTLIGKHATGVGADAAVERGYPANQIVGHAKRGNFDLIVMATHGHTGLEHALLGSITEKVLRKAHCPVLVVR
ncbi:MAG TPA: universal stress protein [Thermoanaerobaculia bacterium]|nr:universal stress protein [Thermoanaerobaculia bacterium]